MTSNKIYIGDIGDENSINDFNEIDLDINSLVSKFVNPIDMIRSRSAPNVFGDLDQVTQSYDSFQESRTHAFYRLLGLPTITSNGKIYSPGFNPVQQNKNIKRYQDINSLITSDVKQCIFNREDYARKQQEIFSKSSINSSITGLGLAVPNSQRPFMTFDSSIDVLAKKDLQQKPIPGRKDFILKGYKKRSDGTELTNYVAGLDTITHILRPFITDPVISQNISPKSGTATTMIAAPFLNKEDTEYEGGKYLKRPGIEFVLRLRLRQQKVLEQIDDYNEIFNLNKTDNNTTIKDIAEALNNTGLSEEEVNQLMYGSTMLEWYTVNSLLKTFKGLIKKYIQNIEEIQAAHKNIIWIPVPNIGGPEKGSETSTAYILPKRFLDSWEVEKKIRILQAKSSIASNQVTIGDDLSFSDFTISEFYNVSNSFSEELQNAKNERSQYESRASNALRSIEYISGEVSGLGLIDIIAIYISLWLIDLDSLLWLIDDDAVLRLSKISELNTQSVTNRINGSSGSAIDAYKTFDKTIISILAYGDRLYKQMIGSPLEEESGDVARSSNGLR